MFAVNEYPAVVINVVLAVLQPFRIGEHFGFNVAFEVFIETYHQGATTYRIGKRDVMCIENANGVRMIKSFQHCMPVTVGTINGDNQALMEERGQDGAIGQLCRRVDMRGLRECAIFRLPVVGRQVQLTLLTCGCECEAVIEGAPTPELLTGLVELYDSVR